MTQEYECSFCGKKGVKLWHPRGKLRPFICAKCAEARQSSVFYNEYEWIKDKKTGQKTGRKTGRQLPLAKWVVNEKGGVPSYTGLNFNGKPYSYTTTLMLDYDSKSMVQFIPADEEVNWNKLPTS